MINVPDHLTVHVRRQGSNTMVCERPPAAYGGPPPHEGENKASHVVDVISPS